MTVSSGVNSQKDRARPEVSDEEQLAVATIVDETLARGFRWLRFPEQLEDLFERETGAARVRHMVVAGLMAILTYDLFLFSDYTMAPRVFETALVVRLGIITPMAILVMIAQYRGLSPLLRESFGALVTACGGVGLIYLPMVSQDPMAAYYVYGLILTTMFGNIVLRLRFFYATAASLAIVVIYAAVRPAAPHIALMVQTNNIIVLVSTALLTLFANYTLERDHRLSYLLSLRDRIRSAALTARNTRLAELSHMDPLTGIANRRELDDYLVHLQRGPRPDMLAIVMFDIDHFKLYNDRYGHPAGDECLRQVAVALRESLRRNNDMVARFGGEEFVVVLPGSDTKTARQVAERMRRAVLDLAIPHASSPAEAVTVSGGVAAGDLHTGAQAILTAADAALYRAKSAGRNCIHE
jgi:diguanylate cyclase (GGDEF)-like protein